MSTGICPVCQRRISIMQGAIGWHKKYYRTVCLGWYKKPLPPIYPKETP